MSDPNDLTAFLRQGWTHLDRGVADATSPARFPTFATTASNGTPEARTVVLRGINQSEANVEVQSDIATDKVAAVRQTPLAALHIWLPGADLQIRLVADVDILTGPNTDEHWNRVPHGSRVSYGTEPIPGTPIAHVYDYEHTSARSRFAVLQCRLKKIDLVHLGPRHRRAVFVREDDWRGTWVAP